MKQKHRVVSTILVISLLLCFGIYLAVKVSAPFIARTDGKVSIEDVYLFLKDGEIFSFADAYPFDWEEVLIANATGGIGDFYQEVHKFDPSFSTWHDVHFLVVFYHDGKVVEYFQYTLGTMEISPVFGEKHQLELNWTKRVQREKALFFCDGFQNNDGVYICTLVSDI